MEQKRYKIKYTYSSRDDIKEKKEYILDTFKYRGLVKRFTDKIKAAVEDLRVFPLGYKATGFSYRRYDIHTHKAPISINQFEMLDFIGISVSIEEAAKAGKF